MVYFFDAYLLSFRHETDDLAARLEQLHERGIPWNEMAIVYRAKWMAEQICDRCQQARIPVEWLNQDQDSQRALNRRRCVCFSAFPLRIFHKLATTIAAFIVLFTPPSGAIFHDVF